MASSQLFVLSVVLVMTASFVECRPKNVALAKNGGTCRASSQQDDNFRCEKAIDGMTYPRTNEWASKWQGVGAWLEITFDNVYRLSFARIMQRLYRNEQSKDVMLEFDWVGQNTQITLTKVNGNNYEDTSAALWDEFDFDKVCTRRVRMDVLTVYSKSNNGFIEVEFYADGHCSLQCDMVSTSFYELVGYNNTDTSELEYSLPTQDLLQDEEELETE